MRSDTVERTLFDADGVQLLPKDRVVLLRGQHKSKTAVVKRIGLKDWKSSHGRQPRMCAVVEVEGRRWGPFGILGDGVRLIERHKDNMAKATESQAWLRVFRFTLQFQFPGPLLNVQYDTTVGAMIAAVTSRGFEVWRAIRPGAKLISEIGESVEVSVTLHGREEGTGRRVVMSIGDPEYLPFGVGVELGGQRVGRLDATDSDIALEGVVFRRVGIVFIEDMTGDDRQT